MLACCGDMSRAQVDQLFNHLSQQLVQVRSSVSDALQSRYDYYTTSPSQLTGEAVDDISRQLTALTAIIDYTEKVRCDRLISASQSLVFSRRNPLSYSDLNSMSFAMNRVLMKIFCSRSSAVIEECRTMFGVPSITDQTHTRKINFLRKFCESDNCLCALFARNASR